jgi:uncharacterized protein YyaL (SSP411 family)
MFLAPDGAPFFGGTYFPKAARYGLPGFPELCERIAEAWRDKRAEIGAQNAEVLKALARTVPRAGASRSEFSADTVRAALRTLRLNFDARFGGFGGAPKFPHPTDLELCLRAGETEIAELTLARMCDGGIYDQLGGGFCRYSVDQYWMIPHFEKMLYDNGPLLALLADAWLVTGNRRFAQCAEETAGWIQREMQSPEGGYFSSLDADSEHEEGKFYVWHRDEVRRLLAPEEWQVAASHFGLDRNPNFEGRHWHLYVAQAVPPAAEAALAAAKAKLFAEREKRVRPGRDEKILVSWNALALRGMARAGRVFGRAGWIDSARRALQFIRTSMWREGRLLATYKDGRAHLDAYLDDYAFLAAALLELMQCEFRAEDLAFAEELAEVMLEQFEDHEAGGFFFTARDHEALIHRPKPGHDNATPSGNAVAAWVLGRLAGLTGESRYQRAAERTLELFYPAMRESPGGFGAMSITLAETLEPPRTLVLRGKADALGEWSRTFAREYLPDTMVLALPDGAKGVPELLDKPARPGPVNAWLCRGVSCLSPMSELEQALRSCKEPSFG